MFIFMGVLEEFYEGSSKAKGKLWGLKGLSDLQIERLRFRG